MRKLKLFSMFLLLLIGVGKMWGNPVSGTIYLGDLTGNWNATTSGSFTDGNNLSWSRTYSSGNKQSIQNHICQFGNSNNACTSLIFTTTIGQAVTLSAFSADFVGGASKTSGTIKLYSGNTELASSTVSGTASVTCQITSSASVGASDAIKVEYTGTNGSIRISQISYTYSTGGSTNPTV